MSVSAARNGNVGTRMARISLRRSVDGAGLAGMGLQLDFPKRRLVLRDILRQNVQQSLGLLRTQVHALEVIDGDRVGSGLIHGSEHQEEIPEVYADLDA